MTTNNYIEKTLLDYRAELEGMIADNEQRKVSGFCPAYIEEHFEDLMTKYHNIIMDLDQGDEKLVKGV